MDLLTQEDVDALEEGDEIVVRWRNSKQGMHRTVVIHNGEPCVREVKPSGFPQIVPLRPLATDRNPKGVQVWWPDRFADRY